MFGAIQQETSNSEEEYISGYLRKDMHRDIEVEPPTENSPKKQLFILLAATVFYCSMRALSAVSGGISQRLRALCIMGDRVNFLQVCYSCWKTCLPL